ncbi:hypothetical protein P7K49_002233 [Saguinus oedipus]|uniref:Uncharacterized protein n=1 Tax=Saguinus oedipus TaxID=9490 RepID=A0ABQ9WKS2_SAGOE|nr:hypothetical protein P7K49_002233 [Saguinus oedipus]
MSPCGKETLLAVPDVAVPEVGQSPVLKGPHRWGLRFPGQARQVPSPKLHREPFCVRGGRSGRPVTPAGLSSRSRGPRAQDFANIGAAGLSFPTLEDFMREHRARPSGPAPRPHQGTDVTVGGVRLSPPSLPGP